MFIHGVEMQKQHLQIALASLVHNPGVLGGWESKITSGLGKTTDAFSEIIKLASELSAGGIHGVGEAKPLQSIFDNLSLPEKNEKEKNKPRRPCYFEPLPLSLTEGALFAKEGNDAGGQILNLDPLVGELENALPREYAETEGYLESVLATLHRFTANAPSSCLVDVSYYDHRRLTAALAVCLADRVKDWTKFTAPADDENVALLVGGDISGIQDFIYTLRAKGAARTLRGRSFYLQLLTEAILRFTLRELDLPYTNVIYSGGGHFFLLAPSSKGGELECIQKKITKTLLKHHRTSLYLALGCAPVPRNGFEKGSFPKHWGEMHAAMAERKRRRYSELDAEMYSGMFEVPETGGNPENTCDACGEDHRALKVWKFKDEDDGRICTLCASFEDLGRELTRSGLLALSFGNSNANGVRDAADALAEFGMTHRFVKKGEETIALQGNETVLWSFDDPDGVKGSSFGNTTKWLRHTANTVPVDADGNALTFDDLQKQVEGGFQRLGVLRMDVDNLGELFKRGLGEDASLARLATLSSRISLFFEGWLKKLCEKDARAGKIYTVYAGGDDVFLLGPWDLIPGLAKDVVDDFARYTGHNADVHASAGMAFIDGKYPVYQAAEDAGDALDAAKAPPEKNAFTFLGKRWGWEEFKEISKKHDDLTSLVKPQEKDKKAAPQAILQVLQQLALEEEQHDKVKGLHVWGRWIWMGMYQLTRMQERRSDLASDIESISDEIQENKYQNIAKWGVAARWTQLFTRKKPDK
jgi:CRISPR-associated protein Csm1